MIGPARARLNRLVTKERAEKQNYRNRDVAIANLADCIEASRNRTCRRSDLWTLSPTQFEAGHSGTRKSVH